MGVVRVLGLVGLCLLAIASLGVIALVQALVRPVDGWQGVVVALIVTLGLGALLLGGAVLWLADAAARDPSRRPVRVGAWVLTVVGLTFWWPLLTKAPTAPIDHYLAVLRAGFLVLGALLLWRISRNQSRPA